MKKYLITFLITTVVFAFAAPAWAKNDSIHFGYKSAALTPRAKTKLSEMSLYLSQYTGSIYLTAYVSDAGDQALNQEFATKRVQAVKAYLVTQGVPVTSMVTQTLPGPVSKARMVMISHGEPPPQPMAATPTAPSTPPPAAPTPPPEAAPPPPEPVITAQPEKRGVEEVDISDKPYREDTKSTPPSRWEY